jgi:poly-gamma-glutamate capsule biosynthesis protein CapA/YwtB (metallophosphatase superfamily)
MILFVMLMTFTSQNQVSLVFGGDVIPHDEIKWQSKRPQSDGGISGFRPFLQTLEPIFSKADFAIVNLETPLVELPKPETGNFIFSAPPDLAFALKENGINVATFANNHCLDQHPEGIISTRAILQDAGLFSVGCDGDEAAAWTPLILEKNGIKIGLMPVTRWLNGFSNRKNMKAHVPAVPYADTPIAGSTAIPEFLNRVSLASVQVDALIVIIHWGAEYKSAPAPEDRKLAAQILEAGAFAIVAHHPHQLQPVEYLHTSDGGARLVAFSLGNLLAAQDYSNAKSLKRDGLLLQLVLAKTDAGIELANVNSTMLTTLTQRHQLRVVPLDFELNHLQDSLDGGSEARVPSAKRAQLKRQLDIARSRKKRIEKLLPTFLLDNTNVIPAQTGIQNGSK